MKWLCFGDSNTYGYDPRSFFGGRYDPEQRWVDLLGQTMGWQMVNAGENGREIPRREGELLGAVQLMEKERPDGLIVMLGSNDLLQGASAETVAVRMEEFLTKLPLERGRILLLAPPPMQLGAWVGTQALINSSRQLGEAYRTLAQRMGLGFADAGAWKIPMSFDGVHFTPEGHAAFARGLAAWFAQHPLEQK